ncbi:3'-5' exonuclease [Halomonas caseinilytica]|uniref:3'-5' exonuclease n=1 Tax=Halomonas caseinilytica TaxID=438744 RepID=UPI0007E59650|nr:3'-5' exonuclease [Halomonas caseinilytica]SEM08995.1 DNA polymerase-3 subunit epsilon [Halomonas caseinilytica]
MFKALRRAADRRRHADGRYGWLFQPYTGDEMVAVACRATEPDSGHGEPVAIAAVRLQGDRVLTSESLDLHVRRPEGLTAESVRRHGLRGVDLDEGEALGVALEQLLDFVGNRPLVGWHLEDELAMLNRGLRPRFGFDLPNAAIDVAHLFQRRQRYRHPQLEGRPRFEEAAERLDVPMMGRHSALGDAVTTALMYLRLARDDAARRRSS